MPDGTGSGRPGRRSARTRGRLFVGGTFRDGASGGRYAVTSAGGGFLADVPLAARGDVDDAVRAARRAARAWSGMDPYRRGEILYRIAELLEGRLAELTAEVAAAEGDGASGSVEAAIARWIWYAGWVDKIAQLPGTAGQVAGAYLGVSTPEPVGVVGVVAPADSALLGLVSVLAPAVVTGNTVVVVAAGQRPLPAITLAEVLAVSDLPAGVVNILSGDSATLARWLVSHRDVDAIDLAGVDDPALVADLEAAAAGDRQRVLRPQGTRPDWSADPGVGRMAAFLTTKTVWYPRGF